MTPSAGRTLRGRLPLLLLTLLAFGLRVWGNEYGFPNPDARPDEDRWVRVGLGLLEDPNPRWFQWPTLHGYLLAALYFAWGCVRVYLRGDFPTFHAYMNEDQSVYLADLVLLGRWSSAVIGALAVPAAAWLAERTGPRGSGLVAAALMAVAFGPVRDAHWALIEPLLLLLIIVTLGLTARALDDPTLGRFAAAGVAAGLTASAKYSGLSLAVPIATAVLLARHAEGRSLLGTPLDRRLWIAGAATVLAFIAGSPGIVASFDKFTDAMRVREWSYRDASFDTPPGYIHHALFSLRYSHGVAGEVAGVAALFVLGVRRRERLPLLAYGVATYAALGPARIIPMRYASSVTPCLVVALGWAVIELSRRLPRPAIASVAAAVLLAAEPAYRCLRFDHLLTRTDTRVAAEEWFAAHVPAGTFVATRDSKALRWARPALEERYELAALDESDGAAGLPSGALDGGYVLLQESFTGYAPFTADLHERVRRHGGRVVAVFDPYASGARPRYDPHDAFFVPVAGFAGVRQPGPRLTVYRLEVPGPRGEGPAHSW